jgi:hypothetical protein
VRRALLAGSSPRRWTRGRWRNRTDAGVPHPANRTAIRGAGADRERSAETELRQARTGPIVVARDQELATLAAGLAAAADGKGRIGLIRGEEGRGKSTLVGELCRRAASQGRFVYAIGSASAQAGAGDPYLPFRELLSHLAGVLVDQETAGADTRAHLSRVQGLLPVAASDRQPRVALSAPSSRATSCRSAGASPSPARSGSAGWKDRRRRCSAAGCRDPERRAVDEYA